MHEVDRVNFQLFHLINDLAGRWQPVDQLVRFAAVDLIFVVFAVAAIPCVAAVRRREFRPLVCLGIALVVAFGLSQALSHTSRERRPFQDHVVHQLIPHGPGISLPSDHATAAFALAFGVWAFLSRRIGAILTVAALLIGLARVWAGVHYPGDILAAAIIAALATFAVHVTDVGARDLPPLRLRA